MDNTIDISNIRNCPWCESSAVTVTRNYVMCCECGMHGPCSTNPNDALRMWNEMCRRQPVNSEKNAVVFDEVCTVTSPTKEGYYWFKGNLSSDARMVKITKEERMKGSSLMVHDILYDEYCPLNEITGYWYPVISV